MLGAGQAGLLGFLGYRLQKLQLEQGSAMRRSPMRTASPPG
ncbi:hypothetical protein ACFQU7_09910 [Pseudoroseomonas wenyumeiae]